MSSFGQPGPRSRRLHVAAVLVLLAMGLGLRLWTAWTLRYSTDPNLAVNGIMTKQIAEGSGFPVFYLGQEQVGTVEFFVAAPFCRLLGCNGFTMNFGVVLFGVAILLVAYLWARHLAGPAAGLAALALLVIGPEHFIRYTGGMGYAAITFTNAAVLAMAGPIVERFRRVGSFRIPDFLLLGFFAGLGWWSSPIIIFSIATAGLVLLMFLRGRLFHWRAWIGGIAGFSLGVAPWLIWNACHGFASLKISSKLGADQVLPDLISFFADTLLPLIGTRPLPRPLGIVLVIAVAALCLGIPVLIAQGLRRKDSSWRARLPSLAILALMLPVTALIYSLTRYGGDHTPRYLLPLVPPGAVACATAITLLGRRWRPAWILLPLLVLAQIPALKQHQAHAQIYAGTHARALQLAEFLRQESLQAAYIPYLDRGLNFELNEEFIFWPVNELRHVPYWDRIERDPRPAVIDHSNAVRRFLAMTDGSAQAAHVAGYDIAYHLSPPADELAEIPPDAIRSIQCDQGQELKPVLCDRMIGSRWRRDSKAAGWVAVHFSQAIPLRALRIEGASRRPPAVQLEGRSPGETAWKPLAGWMMPTDFSWWGPRLYSRGIFQRLEYRVPPREIESLRIRHAGGKRWDMSELRLFTSQGPAPDPREALASLRARLEQRPPARLYCDRWVGSQLRGNTSCRLETEHYVHDESDPAYDRTLTLEPGLALLVAAEDAAMTRAALAAAKIEMSETALGPWTLFDFGSGDWNAAYQGNRALHWTGSGVLLAGGRPWSLGLKHLGDSARAQDGREAEAEALYREALRVFPQNKPAADRLAELLRKTGRQQEAEEMEKTTAALWSPALPAAADFGRGVQLLGLSADPLPIERGKPLRLKTYWRCPPDRPVDSLAAFVHFRKDATRFQGDHPLAFDGWAEQPQPWVFVLENTIAVPAEIPAGTFHIDIGVFNVLTGKRLSARSELPVRRNAVRMPARVEVE